MIIIADIKILLNDEPYRLSHYFKCQVKKSIFPPKMPVKSLKVKKFQNFVLQITQNKQYHEKVLLIKDFSNCCLISLVVYNIFS